MDQKRFLTIGTKSFVSVLLILLGLIVFAGVLAYLIPQGSYLRNDALEIIGPYEAIATSARIPIWKIGLSFLLVFTTADAVPVVVISLFLLILGGAFQVMQSAKGIQVFIDRLVLRFKEKKYVLFSEAASPLTT